MDGVTEVLERQLAHLRKMVAMMETGGISMRSEGRDVTAETADEYRLLEAELSAALARHEARNA